jgi:pimeloyl-ACP methyl ester carboxylesterase
MCAHRDVRFDTVINGDVTLNVAFAGSGPPVVLVHGWPHTWQVWSAVIPELARSHTVAALDLRGMGASSRPEQGYDAATIAGDLRRVQEHLGSGPTSVVAMDLGTPAAVLLATLEPARVRRLVVMESVLPGLPVGGGISAQGQPWWFGFHAVPGLAERVLEGHEADYIDWFLTAHSASGHGVPRPQRDAFVAANTGRSRLRSGFEHYRAKPRSGQQLQQTFSGHRLRVPTLVMEAGLIKDALYNQLVPVADDLQAHTITDCGHHVPLEQPHVLLEVITPFLAA